MKQHDPDDDVWEEEVEEVESIEDIIDDMFPEGVDDGFNWAGD